MNAILDAVTPTAVRTFPTTPNRGDLSLREIIGAYMATYTGSDDARASRVEFWSNVLGVYKLADLGSDLIADHLDQLVAEPSASTSAKTSRATASTATTARAAARPSTAIARRCRRCSLGPSTGA